MLASVTVVAVGCGETTKITETTVKIYNQRKNIMTQEQLSNINKLIKILLPIGIILVILGFVSPYLSLLNPPKIPIATYERQQDTYKGMKTVDIYDKEYPNKLVIIDKENCQIENTNATYKIKKDKYGWYMSIKYTVSLMGNKAPVSKKYYFKINGKRLRLWVNPSWKTMVNYEPN